jgi:hypothetical protein
MSCVGMLDCLNPVELKFVTARSTKCVKIGSGIVLLLLLLLLLVVLLVVLV